MTHGPRPGGFALVVRFTLRDGHERAFDALVERTLEGIRTHEPGTLVYAVHVDERAPSVRVFYELYADRAAFEAHESQAHVRAFLAEREQHVSGVEVASLTLAAAVGVPGGRPLAGH